MSTEPTAPAAPERYAAALLNLPLLAAFIWVTLRWGGSIGRLVLAVAGTALLVKEFALALGHPSAEWKARTAALVDAGVRGNWVWPLAAASLLAIAWCAWRIDRRWVSSALLMLSPVLFVTAGQSAWRLAALPTVAAGAMPQKASVSPRVSGPRVVWIVFDELDERIAFSQPPTGLALPSLDAFRAQSILFRHALSPSNSTDISIPTMLGHIFERPGLRAGVVGWYLPYCRVYGKLLAACRDWPMNRQTNSYGSGLPAAVGNQWRSFFESSLYSIFGQSLAVEAHIRTIGEMDAAAASLAADPRLDLVFLHFPVPHSPYVYDAGRRQMSAANQGASGYVANLLLADRLFGHVVARLSQSGLAARTHVLVTGDHGFRRAAQLGYPPEDRHMPLMWKPAGDGVWPMAPASFETCQMSALISRILDGGAPASVLAGYP